MTLEQDIAGSASASDALDIIVRHFAADSGTIHVLGEDGLLHLLAIRGEFPESVLAAIRVIPPGKGMAGLAFQRGEPVDSCNIQTDTSGDVRTGARATGLGGAIVVPIFQRGDIIGTLGIASRAERTFNEMEISLLMAAARMMSGRNMFNEPDTPIPGPFL
ncbi:MAG: GAF domain-containing protein [Rhodomicrobium sp.]